MNTKKDFLMCWLGCCFIGTLTLVAFIGSSYIARISKISEQEEKHYTKELEADTTKNPCKVIRLYSESHPVYNTVTCQKALVEMDNDRFIAIVPNQMSVMENELYSLTKYKGYFYLKEKQLLKEK